MYYIKDAEYRRVTEHEGKPCVEILVHPGAAQGPELYVYVARSSNGDQYDIVKMLRSDASPEIDWFDNNLSQAFATVHEKEFGDEGWPEPAQQREQFKQNLLAYPAIATSLRSYLPLYVNIRQIKPL